MEGNSVTLKTYQAFTMAEALAAVKRDLGSDAVILHTRSFRRRRLLGLWWRTIVEVTATPAVQQRSEAVAAAPRPKVKSAAAQRAYASVAEDGSAARTCAGAPTSTRVLDDRQRTKRLAMAMDETNKRRAPEVGVMSIPKTNPVPGADPTSDSTVFSSRRGIATLSAARRFLLTAPQEGREYLGNAAAALQISEVEVPLASRTMQDELSAIKDLVGHVLQRQVVANGARSPAMPKRLFEFYLQMIGQDIADELADQIVNDVRDELSAADLEDEQATRSAILRHLAKLIPAAEHATLEHSSDGRPLTIALIGPTGVGKTTTLAKLAASFKLRHNKKVGLITCDTYRIAAVDQLRTYANIINLPLHVAMNAAEMRQAVAALRESDVILIDTAGRSQNDSGRLEELRQFLAAAAPHEVHLVLSSTAGEKVLLNEAEAFSAVGVHKILLTKLDEAVSFGMLVNVIRQVGKQLSFVTTGQEVPTHLEIGRAERLAELVLGGPVHG
jgi:flagellar biosynthesis protein FlhF